MNDVTEEDVVFAFAKAWNRLEPDGFLVLLSPDARYASQWVFEELGGLAVFFCSPAADNVRGVAWNMDGGWAAQ